MAKFFEDSAGKNKNPTRYEPKRNMHTELRHFVLQPWRPDLVPGSQSIWIVGVADNAGDTYIALRDTATKKEYVEKAILSVSGDYLKVSPIKIEDDLEWNSAFEFFAKMGIIQTKASSWRWNSAETKP